MSTHASRFLRFSLPFSLRNVFVLVPLIALGCGSDSTNQGDPDAGPDDEVDAGTGSNDGVLPPLVPQSGIAYVAHYHDTSLRSVRTDRSVPEPGPTLDLGQPTHDLILDDEGNQLIAISDVGRKAQIFSLERPANSSADVAAPTKTGEIIFTHTPRFAMVNPYRSRLYVVTADPAQNPLTTMSLHAYDISSTTPVAIDGWPVEIPVTVSITVDPVRDVVFLVELTTDTLFAYDVGLDQFEALGGTPIELLAQFPQQNQASFQARSLTADFRRNRLVAARSQSALSELIVIDYPADIPTGGARYRDFVDLGELSFVDDGFDVDVELDQRSNLLDAYVPAIDAVTGAIFLSSDAWNGTASMATLTAFDSNAGLVAGCDEVPDEGFGCFLRGYVAGEAVSYKRTDGAMCVDAANRRVVATSIDLGDETQPGQVHVFDYAADLSSMSAAIPADGGNVAAGALPIGVVCH